jgi:hypothetical protein
MRRFALPVIFLTVLAPACSRQRAGQDLPLVEEENLLSTLAVADPAAAEQLLSGWHQVEHDSWRWTKRDFSAALKSPAGKAGTLELKFFVPEPALVKLHSLTLTASIGGVALSPETYTRPGVQTYRREIPAAALRGGLVRIDFHLDKALPPDGNDQRELGVVVQSVGLRESSPPS